MNPAVTRTSTVKKSALVLGSTSKPSLVRTTTRKTKKYSSPITTAATLASSAVFNTNRHSLSINTSQGKESNKAAYKTAFVQKRSSVLKKSMTSTAGSNNLKKSLNSTSGTLPYKETDEALRSRNPPRE